MLLHFGSPSAWAQIVVSVNDGKQVLVAGAQVVPSARAPDTLSLIDLSAKPPRLVGSVEVPTSVIGPPGSVAISPDGSYALVTAARRIATADPTQIEPDDIVSVVDLKSIRVVATLHAGPGASGVAINPSANLALVANRSEGTVSVLSLSRADVKLVGKVTLGDAKSAPAQPIFFDNGRRALVTRDGDNKISLLTIRGTEVTVSPATLASGLRPYQIDTTGPRRFAVVANIGGGGRDIDTISLIDLAEETPRVVDTVAVGLTPEGVKMSPDGQYVAVNVNNGSNANPSSSLYHPTGLLQIWRVVQGHLGRVVEAPIGGWGQGIAWSRDAHTLLVQSMIAKDIEVFEFDGQHLRQTGRLPMPAGPAAIATVEP
jgi:DNA-binding beta-propeller fold protein YncE